MANKIFFFFFTLCLQTRFLFKENENGKKGSVGRIIINGPFSPGFSQVLAKGSPMRIVLPIFQLSFKINHTFRYPIDLKFCAVELILKCRKIKYQSLDLKKKKIKENDGCLMLSSRYFSKNATVAELKQGGGHKSER